jgi:hypothetical protein
MKWTLTVEVDYPRNGRRPYVFRGENDTRCVILEERSIDGDMTLWVRSGDHHEQVGRRNMETWMNNVKSVTVELSPPGPRTAGEPMEIGITASIGDSNAEAIHWEKEFPTPHRVFLKEYPSDQLWDHAPPSCPLSVGISQGLELGLYAVGEKPVGFNDIRTLSFELTSF